MLFSVVIPLYNKERYIRAAIDSILAQHCQDFEIIVVDDGSTDQGAAVVLAMADARIHLLRTANGGVARARNAGIDAAQGSLLCFLDADDWYAPRYLSCIAAMWRRHPEQAFYATSYLRIPDGSGLILGDDADAAASASVVANFFDYRHRNGFFFSTCSVVIPLPVLRTMQPCFPVGEQFGEDQDLWFRLAETLRLVFCPAKLVAYRIGLADSLTATQGLNVLPPVFTRLEQRVRAGTVPAGMRRPALRIVSDARLAVARHCLAAGRRRPAFKALLAAARHGISRKWWVTAVLCGLGSPALARKWEAWRTR